MPSPNSNIPNPPARPDPAPRGPGDVSGPPSRPDPRWRGRWEDDGGSTGDNRPGAQQRCGAEAPPTTPTRSERDDRDAAQDELMARASPDGRPPSHAVRRIEWWVLSGVAVVSLVGAALFGLATGMTTTAWLGGMAVFVALLGAAALPVLGAAVARGREQRTARRQSGPTPRAKT